MAQTGSDKTSATWLKRGRRVALALAHWAFDRLQSKVFRFAFLTVMLIAGVQQFVGWKYIGVVVREAVASVQSSVLPWIGPDSEQRLHKEAGRKVVALLISDQFFADSDGFQHQVPLPPERVALLLQRVLDRAKTAAADHPLLVIDFDLSPRIAEDATRDDVRRKALDDWLQANAAALVLVEPSWAARHASTLARQLAWARRLCGYGDASTQRVSAAVFAQSSLVSRFGFVLDRLPLDGRSGPAWDIGRAVADQLGSPAQHRNPLCDRLQGKVVADPASAPPLLLDLQLQLTAELSALGALAIQPQPVQRHGQDMLELRSEAIHSDPDCTPSSFDEVAGLKCLDAAEVVVIGGAWRFGFSDRQDTFVGEADGAVVHAAWIRSWLNPVTHLWKVFEILLDVVIIESLLHPILEFAFFGMKREAGTLSRHMKDAAEFEHMGLMVCKALALASLALAAVVATSMALILFDGLLRWAFDSALTLDKTIPALLIWAGVALGGQSHDEPPIPIAPLGWLMALVLVSVATVFTAWARAAARPDWVPLVAVAGIAAVPLAFVLHQAFRRSQVDPEASVCARAIALRGHWTKLLNSIRHSLLGGPGGSPAPTLVMRAGDAFGAMLWLAIWGFALVLFVQSTLWSFVLALLGG